MLSVVRNFILIRLISEKFVIKKLETKSNYMLIVVRFSDDRKRKQ